MRKLFLFILLIINCIVCVFGSECLTYTTNDTRKAAAAVPYSKLCGGEWVLMEYRYGWKVPKYQLIFDNFKLKSNGTGYISILGDGAVIELPFNAKKTGNKLIFTYNFSKTRVLTAEDVLASALGMDDHQTQFSKNTENLFKSQLRECGITNGTDVFIIEKIINNECMVIKTEHGGPMVYCKIQNDRKEAPIIANRLEKEEQKKYKSIVDEIDRQREEAEKQRKEAERQKEWQEKKQKAIDGDREAQYDLGCKYLTEKEKEQACLWLEKSAVQGYKPAQKKLGQIKYDQGKYSEALVWFRKAQAQELEKKKDQKIFNCYMQLAKNSTNPKEAEMFYKSAWVEAPDSESLSRVLADFGDFYLSENNYINAELLYATMSPKTAQIKGKLINIYDILSEQSSDTQEKIKWNEKKYVICNTRKQRSQLLSLYINYGNECEINNDYHTAFTCYRKGKELGSAKAINKLADLYQSGQGVAKNKDYAKNLRKIASADETILNKANGVLPGKFSVSGTKKVRFSMGNLKFNYKTKTWAFHDNQWGMLGTRNEGNGSEWWDLFPLQDPDVFHHAINNGGEISGIWRQLSKEEWNYLENMRPNAEALKAKATVNNVNGMVFLPDDFVIPRGLCFFSSNKTWGNSWAQANSIYNDTKNTYTDVEWERMEAAGAIFLPCGGRLYAPSDKIYEVNVWGHYQHTSFIYASPIEEFPDYKYSDVHESIRLVYIEPEEEP